MAKYNNDTNDNNYSSSWSCLSMSYFRQKIFFIRNQPKPRTYGTSQALCQRLLLMQAFTSNTSPLEGPHCSISHLTLIVPGDPSGKYILGRTSMNLSTQLRNLVDTFSRWKRRQISIGFEERRAVSRILLTNSIIHQVGVEWNPANLYAPWNYRVKRLITICVTTLLQIA